MGRISDRLEELGIGLAEPHAPVADYLPCKLSGTTLYVSARVSQARGVVGADLKIPEAKAAARETALHLLSIIQADIGDLDRIKSIDMVRGFVRSAPTFTQQPLVIDGASEVLIEIFGENGRHARTATGAAQLPFGAAIQLDMILQLRATVP